MIPTQVLIKLVRKRKCLWDRHHPKYKESKAKRSAWYEIFKEFEPAYETLEPAKKEFIRHEIKRKWYNARDSYVKSLRPGAHHRPYVHSDELQFLGAIYLSNSEQQRLKPRDSPELLSHETEAVDDVEQNYETEVKNDLNAERLEVENDSLKVKRRRLEDTEINVVSVLANLLHKEDDEDRAFFTSITPAVKLLSEHSKLKFRVQVIKLINSLKERDQEVTVKVERVSDVDSVTG